MSKKSAGGKKAPGRPAERPVRPRSRRSTTFPPAVVPTDPTPVENVAGVPGAAEAEPDASAARAERGRSHHERVADRAYALYQSRGAADGDALGDWLEAERQIAGEDRSSERPE